MEKIVGTYFEITIKGDSFNYENNYSKIVFIGKHCVRCFNNSDNFWVDYDMDRIISIYAVVYSTENNVKTDLAKIKIK